MPSLVNTNKTAAQDRKERTNDLYSRTQARVGGWKTTPSGMRAGTVQVVSAGGGERIRVSDKIMNSGATLAEALDNSETGIDVSAGTKFAVGETIRIDSEHMYIQSISSNTLTVKRPTDGTSAVVHSTGLIIYKINPKTPTRYSELGSETLKFIKDGSSFNYPKQMQFIPASVLNFGSAFSFVSDGDLVNYDDDQYDVLFILKDMQTYSVTGSDESSNQFLQVSAESKSATGFTPTANVGVRVLSSVVVNSSFDEEAFAFNGSALADPTYATDRISDDAMHDVDTDDVTALTVTYTLTFSAVKGSGEFEVDGFIRAGTEDTGNTNRFISTNYEQTSFSEFRDAGFGDGTVTRTVSFTFDAALGSDPCKVVATITSYDQLGGSTATLAGEITEIVYTTSSGATRSITGRNRADAIVIAR
jgi:hypothetical protein